MVETRNSRTKSKRDETGEEADSVSSSDNSVMWNRTPTRPALIVKNSNLQNLPQRRIPKLRRWWPWRKARSLLTQSGPLQLLRRKYGMVPTVSHSLSLPTKQDPDTLSPSVMGRGGSAKAPVAAASAQSRNHSRSREDHSSQIPPKKEPVYWRTKTEK